MKNKNKIVKALENTDIKFTIRAIFSGSDANMAKKAPIIWNKGAPGGCPICNFAEVEIYSPASQKLAVGSTVKLYVARAIKNTNNPKILFQKVKDLLFINNLKEYENTY